MVQLSVLLCFIPLCLDNAMMQAHITKVRIGSNQVTCWDLWYAACNSLCFRCTLEPPVALEAQLGIIGRLLDMATRLHMAIMQQMAKVECTCASESQTL
jgi:hypothetical protein